jgi:GNAT superfamily N-acetyltransferase
MQPYHTRLATLQDIPALHTLMQLAISDLQKPFLTPAQIEASRQVMGIDTQLLQDSTYFLMENAQEIVGCGGWSWRATLYGGDTSVITRAPETLNPATDAARIRAMYTHPAHVRRGIGRALLRTCEEAAHHYGFLRAEMMATLAGAPLYRACGYVDLEFTQAPAINGVTVPLIRMGKSLRE